MQILAETQNEAAIKASSIRTCREKCFPLAACRSELTSSSPKIYGISNLVIYPTLTELTNKQPVKMNESTNFTHTPPCLFVDWFC